MKVTKTLTKHSDINIGDKVEVISEVVDFNFFKEGTVGTVIKKEDDYLGIIVRFKDGNTFNFNPENLKVIKTITNIPDTKQKLLEEFENKVATFPIYDYLGGDITEQFKQFLSKAIDQTREETIRKVEEILPDEYDLTESESVSLLNKIKQSLNKLKK